MKLPLEKGELGVCVHKCVCRKAQGKAENWNSGWVPIDWTINYYHNKIYIHIQKL